MPLQKQVVGVQFTQGLDTKSNPKVLRAGKYQKLENLSLTADYTPARRDGYKLLVSPNIGITQGLALYDSQLLGIGSITSSSANSISTDNGQVVGVGPVANVNVSKQSLRRTTGFAFGMDCAINGTMSCHAWEEESVSGVGGFSTTQILYTVLDDATGAVIVNAAVATAAGSAFGPRVVAAAGGFFIFWIDGTSLKGRFINANTPTAISSTVALVTNANLSDINFDACTFNNLGLVVYGFGDGTTSVQAITVTTSAGAPSVSTGPKNIVPNATIAAANVSGIACAAFDSSHAGIYVLGGTASGLWATTIDNTVTVTAGPTQIDATVRATAGACHVAAGLSLSLEMAVFYDNASSWGNNGTQAPLQFVLVGTGATAINGPTTLMQSNFYSGGSNGGMQNGPVICGKPFASGGIPWVPCFVGGWQNGGVQPSFFLIDNSGNIVASALRGTYGINSVNNNSPIVSTPCSTYQNGSSFFTDVGERGRLNITSGIFTTPTGVAKLGLTPNVSTSLIHQQLGRTLMLASGAPTQYDGSAMVEAGFHLYPEGITAAGTAGALSYQYCATYEWVDGAGQRHESAPSPVVTISITGPSVNAVTVKVPTLTIGSRAALCSIVIWRTLSNGQTFFRLQSMVAPIRNNTGAAIITYTDSATDVSISSNEQLTQAATSTSTGTTLINNAPPPCSVLWVHQDRIFTDVGDDPNAFAYSQQWTQGNGIMWSDGLRGRTDPTGGSIVGGATMDDQCVIFCQRKIFRMYGQGPTPDGNNSTYSIPVEIPSDVGCSDARSILQMPHGIIFKATKGWHLLDRGFNVVYIGTGAEKFNSNSVLAAILLHDRKECRFVTTNGSVVTTLVWSYMPSPVGDGTADQWSTTVGPSPVDALWHPISGYVHATSLGVLNVDTPGSYADGANAAGVGGTGIVTTEVTAPLKLGAMQGFARLWRIAMLGQSLVNGSTTSQLSVTLDFDYGTGGEPGQDSFTIADVFASTDLLNAPAEFRHVPARQKCESVTLTIVDTPNNGSAVIAGYNWQGVTLELGVKRGLTKLPPSQSV